jgi:hypothetical protein
MQTGDTILIGLLAAGLCLGGCVGVRNQFETDVQTKIGVVGERLETLAEVKTEVTALGNKIGFVNDRLEKLVEQTQTVSVSAEKVGKLTQVTQQQLADKVELIHKTIQAGSIHYGGAGWVVLGVGVIVALFLVAGVGAFFVVTRSASKFKNLLTLVTSAVQQAPPEVQDEIKSQIEQATSNGGPWDHQHKQALADFARAVGTFIPRNTETQLPV